MARKSSNRRLTNGKGRRARRSGESAKSGSREFKLAFFIQRNLALHTLPRPMHSGRVARYRMHANTFGVSTGLSNVGGSSGPGQLVQNSATLLNAAIGTQLSDYAGYSSYAAIYDQYRIKEVLIRFKSRNNAVNLVNTASPNGSVPTAYIVRDLDDATALSTPSEALEYDTVHTFNGEEDCVVRFDPAVTPAVYSGGAFSGYGVQHSDMMWLDVANTAIPHYGIKVCVGALTASTTSSWVWDLTMEAIVEFQNTR